MERSGTAGATVTIATAVLGNCHGAAAPCECAPTNNEQQRGEQSSPQPTDVLFWALNFVDAKPESEQSGRLALPGWRSRQFIVRTAGYLFTLGPLKMLTTPV